MSRQAAQVAALVDLLKAQPEDTLAAVLDGLGIAQERRPEPARDTRRCAVCGKGWVVHKALSDRPNDGHEWEPS